MTTVESVYLFDVYNCDNAVTAHLVLNDLCFVEFERRLGTHSQSLFSSSKGNDSSDYFFHQVQVACTVAFI